MKARFILLIILILGASVPAQQKKAETNWAQRFKASANFDALLAARRAFEAAHANELNAAAPADSTLSLLINVYEAYFGSLYPALSKDFTAHHISHTDTAAFRRIFDRYLNERESVYTVLSKLCAKKKTKPTPRICQGVQSYFEEKRFRQDFRTKPAPDFSFTDMNGDSAKLSDFKGRYVLLHFWSMHSVPCVQELKDLKRAARMYPKRLQIISINTDPVQNTWDRKTLLNFIKEMELNWVHISDAGKRLFNRFHVHNYPTLYLIDPRGFAVNPDFKLGKELRGEQLLKTLRQALRR